MTIPWKFFGYYSLEEWKEIIDDWERSNLSKYAYCKLKNIPYSSFRTWHAKVYPSNNLSLKEIQERWEKIVRDWEKSGLSKSAYCRKKRLHIPTFCKHERRVNSHILRKTNHEEALEKWAPIIEGWKKSGLSKFMYAREHRITYCALCKWIKYFDENHQVHPDPPKTLYKEDPQLPKDPRCPHSFLFKETPPINQKIEVFLAHGEHFCLEGPFDGLKLVDCLTPLLRR